MKAVGFSAHAPLPFETEWTLKHDNAPAYIREIQRLKAACKTQIDIYLGLEADYIPGLSTSFAELKKTFGLDYIIGSIHLVKAGTNDVWFIDGPEENFTNGLRDLFHNDARAAVTAFYRQTQEMMATQQPDVVGHIDKVKMYNRNRFFDENAPWYTALIDETLDVAARYGTIVEVNTRGVYSGKTTAFFPSDDFIERCDKKGVKMMINADAHKPHELLLKYDEARLKLKNAGFTELYIPGDKEHRVIPIDLY
jgi:histidinol-phosphatase (PHP family)